MIKIPIVFLVFNRPELTRRVFQRIREAQPAKLLVVCDGPRSSVPSDAERIARVRETIDAEVDWPCEIRRNYADLNMGCRDRVVSGLDWAFSLEEEAIILEDDCLPDLSFFKYCESLLGKYRDEPKVMHIGGNNFQNKNGAASKSYFFSKYNHVWGWATWRRAWRLLDMKATCWISFEGRRKVEATFDSAREAAYWSSIFDGLVNTKATEDVWDYYWTLACWYNRGLATYPTVNLVQNIGIGCDATHTKVNSWRHCEAENIGTVRIEQRIIRNKAADQYTFEAVFMDLPTLALRTRHRLKRLSDKTRQFISSGFFGQIDK